MGISVRCGEFAGGTTNRPSLEGVVAYLIYIRKVIESRLFKTKIFFNYRNDGAEAESRGRGSWTLFTGGCGPICGVAGGCGGCRKDVGGTT